MEHVKQQASSKRRLKLGDIAEHLQVKKFVVRAWEKELGLAPQGGLYGAEDVELFKKIKQLVLVEHKSIAHVRDVIGARKIETAVPADIQSVTGASVCETEYHAAMMQDESLLEVEEAGCVEAALSQSCEGESLSMCEAVVEQADVVAAPVEVPVEVLAVVPEAVLEQELAAVPVEAECVAESAMEAAASCAEEASTQTVVAAQVIAAPVQQEFLEELAFFKQELTRFQELLKA